jgi:hypothetical protein
MYLLDNLKKPAASVGFKLQDRFMMLRCRLLFTNSADANSAGDHRTRLPFRHA